MLRDAILATAAALIDGEPAPQSGEALRQVDAVGHQQFGRGRRRRCAQVGGEI